MEQIQYFHLILTLGIILTIIGVIAYFKNSNKEKNGSNKIKLMGLELELSSASLTIIGIGVLLFLFPLLSENKGFLNERLFSSDELPKVSLSEAIDYYKEGDLQNAFTGFKSLAEGGNMEAQWHYGEMLKEGEGVPRNKEKGMKWIQKSADNGYPIAIAMIGFEYLEEGYFDMNLEKAETYFQRAADKGSMHGDYGLGRVAEDKGEINKAIVMYRKAAKVGLPMAQYFLSYNLYEKSRTYLHSNSTSSDIQLSAQLLRESEDWAEKSAKQGNEWAMAQMTLINYDRWKVTEDEVFLKIAYYYLKLYQSRGFRIDANEEWIRSLTKAMSSQNMQKLYENKAVEKFTPEYELESFHTHFVE